MESVASVADVYEGFYAGIRAQGKEGNAFLGGAEGIVGAELELRLSEEGLGVIAHDGRKVAVLDEDADARLAALLRRGWRVHCILAYVSYNIEEKSFAGELACVAYDHRLDDRAKDALDAFVCNSAERIASASRPLLALTQEQFVRVVESGGTWFLTKEELWPKLPKGSVFYRRRRSFNDRLVGAALKGNRGCLVASWLGAALVVVVALAAAWLLFFSG
jgi:hypothetical protein